jgi:enterochelin esterase family protein
MRTACLALLPAALLAAATAVAQNQPPAQGRPRGTTAPVRSPEVQADGRVTFRLRAPNATSVAVARDGAPPMAMQKDEQGVWSVMTDPLPPDIFPTRSTSTARPWPTRGTRS